VVSNPASKRACLYDHRRRRIRRDQPVETSLDADTIAGRISSLVNFSAYLFREDPEHVKARLIIRLHNRSSSDVESLIKRIAQPFAIDPERRTTRYISIIGQRKARDSKTGVLRTTWLATGSELLSSVRRLSKRCRCTYTPSARMWLMSMGGPHSSPRNRDGPVNRHSVAGSTTRRAADRRPMVQPTKYAIDRVILIRTCVLTPTIHTRSAARRLSDTSPVACVQIEPANDLTFRRSDQKTLPPQNQITKERGPERTSQKGLGRRLTATKDGFLQHQIRWVLVTERSR